MPRFFSVVSAWETVLQRRSDGRLVHAPGGWPGLSPVIAESISDAAEIWLLRAVSGGRGIHVGDRVGNASEILPLMAIRDGDGFRLRAPISGDEISAVPDPAGAEGSIETGVRGSVFRRGEAVDADEPSSPMNLDLPAAVDLLASDDPRALPLAAGVLRSLPFASMREAWASVADTSTHDRLFPIIQERARESLGTFPGYTASVMAGDIAKHGWSVGDRTYGRPLVIEAGRGQLTIGRYCAMADPTIVLANHQVRAASTYPFMDLWAEWPGARVGLADHVNGDVVIGNDVWIGVGAIILPGAIVGDGALIGAGAVVRGTVPPYAICVGNPGEIRRHRFAPDVIERLLAIGWWHWPDAVVSRYIPLLVGESVLDFLAAAEAEFGDRRQPP
jgi:acetyltransferase-like isoleucine patch superfamily enzyme